MERYTPGGVPIYDGDAFGWSMRQGILNSPTHIAQRGYAIGFRQGAATVPAGGGGSSDILAGKTMSEHPTVGQTTAAVKTVWRALGGSFTTAAAALALLVLPVSGDQYADTALLDSLRGDVDRVVTNVKGPQIVSDAAAAAAAHTDATAERLRAEIASATNGIPESVDAAAGTAHSELLAAKAGLRAEIASATNGLPESISATETALRGEIASATNGIPESVSAAKAGLRAEIASATNGLRGVLDLATYRETGTGEWTPDPIPPSGAKEYAPRGSPSFSPASSNWTWTVEVRVGGVVASTYDAVTGPVPGEDSGTRLLFSDPRGEGPSFYAERARGYAVTGRIATEAYVDSKAVRTNEVQDIARSEIAPATGAVYRAMIDYVNLHGPTGSVSEAEATNIAEAVVGSVTNLFREKTDRKIWKTVFGLWNANLPGGWTLYGGDQPWETSDPAVLRWAVQFAQDPPVDCYSDPYSPDMTNLTFRGYYEEGEIVFTATRESSLVVDGDKTLVDSSQLPDPFSVQTGVEYVPRDGVWPSFMGDVRPVGQPIWSTDPGGTPAWNWLLDGDLPSGYQYLTGPYTPDDAAGEYEDPGGNPDNSVFVERKPVTSGVPNEVDTSPTETHISNLVTSAGVFAALGKKRDLTNDVCVVSRISRWYAPAGYVDPGSQPYFLGGPSYTWIWGNFAANGTREESSSEEKDLTLTFSGPGGGTTFTATRSWVAKSNEIFVTSGAIDPTSPAFSNAVLQILRAYSP